MSSNPSRRRTHHLSTNNKRHSSELYQEPLSRRKNNLNDGNSSEESRSSSSASDDTATTCTISRKKKPRHCQEESTCGGGPSRSVMGWNLFVTGLPADIYSDQEVEDYFARHGHVQSIRLIRKAVGRVWNSAANNKGPPAIVEFANQQEAQNALNHCHQSAFREGSVLSVTWAFVQPPSLSTIRTGENRM